MVAVATVPSISRTRLHCRLHQKTVAVALTAPYQHQCLNDLQMGVVVAVRGCAVDQPETPVLPQAPEEALIALAVPYRHLRLNGLQTAVTDAPSNNPIRRSFHRRRKMALVALTAPCLRSTAINELEQFEI
jgi:hypothetical protein